MKGREGRGGRKGGEGGREGGEREGGMEGEEREGVVILLNLAVCMANSSYCLRSIDHEC